MCRSNSQSARNQKEKRKTLILFSLKKFFREFFSILCLLIKAHCKIRENERERERKTKLVSNCSLSSRRTAAHAFEWHTVGNPNGTHNLMPVPWFTRLQCRAERSRRVYGPPLIGSALLLFEVSLARSRAL